MTRTSKLYNDAQIVDLVYPGGDVITLVIETSCDFHLATKTVIPLDMGCIEDLDIPTFDGRDLVEWINQTIAATLFSRVECFHVAQ